MTRKETRQLGIEFERRIRLMDPSLEIANKLDTDTIYAMLNEYQIKYVKQMYLAEQQADDNQKAKMRMSDILKTFLTRVELSVNPNNKNTDSDNYNVKIDLPSDYWMYERSVSKVDRTHSNPNSTKTSTAVNVLIKEQEANDVIVAFNNSFGIIRNPLVLLEGNQMKIIHDYYTNILSVDLVYYRMPRMFNVINTEDANDDVSAVHSNCELPYECFDELVDGAVKLYMMEYKYALSLAANDRKDNAIKKNLRKLTKDEGDE